MSCPHRLAWRNPLGQSDIHIECLKTDPDQQHEGLLYQTAVSWETDDRRDYTGTFPGWCQKTPGCVLPLNHPRGCAT